MDGRARKRNGATTAKVGSIITATHATHWKRTNRTNCHSIRKERPQMKQNKEESRNDGTWGPNKHEFNNADNGDQTVQKTLNKNMSKTPLTVQVEVLEYI